jgi:putative aminopeptidase FrvX
MSCLLFGIIIGIVLIIACVCLPHNDGFTSQIIKDLTKFNGRKPGTLGHYHSHLYLLNKVKELEKYGTIEDVPWAPSYMQKFADKNKGGQNIVFMIPGELPGKIIIMAHLDHIGEGYQGADDNGSGVFGLLQVAKRMAKAAKKKKPKHNILFVLTDCEETTFRGSHLIYSRFPSKSLVINIDSIGSFPEGKPVQIANGGHFSKFLKERASQNSMEIELVPIKYGRSDITHFLHENVCVEFGFITSESKIHTHYDTYENLHLKNMYKVITLAGDLVEHVSYSSIL